MLTPNRTNALICDKPIFSRPYIKFKMLLVIKNHNFQIKKTILYLNIWRIKLKRLTLPAIRFCKLLLHDEMHPLCVKKDEQNYKIAI